MITNLTSHEALQYLLIDDLYIRRAKWKPNTFVTTRIFNSPEELPYLEITVDGKSGPYMFHQCDIFATDWEAHTEI